METVLVKEILRTRKDQSATLKEAQFCILVADLIPSGTVMPENQKGGLLFQIGAFPQATDKERVVSATAIATWVMLFSLLSQAP